MDLHRQIRNTQRLAGVGFDRHVGLGPGITDRLDLLRAQIAAAFGDDPRSPVTGQLARFALAAVDGAFVPGQTDRGATLELLVQPLAPSLVASRRTLLAGS